MASAPAAAVQHGGLERASQREGEGERERERYERELTSWIGRNSLRGVRVRCRALGALVADGARSPELAAPLHAPRLPRAESTYSTDDVS